MLDPDDYETNSKVLANLVSAFVSPKRVVCGYSAEFCVMDPDVSWDVCTVCVFNRNLPHILKIHKLYKEFNSQAHVSQFRVPVFSTMPKQIY